MYVRQDEAFEFMTSYFDLTAEERDLYRRIMLEGPIRGRYIGMDAHEDAGQTDPDQLLSRFLKYGRLIGTEAARKALKQAGFEPSEIDGLVVNTCTGYLCPGLTSYIAEDLGLPETTRPFDLMGMGCGGALPNLECATGMLARGAGTSVLCLSIEVCSATMVMGSDPGLIVSNCIFGDGASAAIVSNGGASANGGALTLLDFESALAPRFREQLRYVTQGGRLRNQLTPRVPRIGSRVIAGVADRLLARRGLRREDVACWVVHAGGTRVLDHVARELGIGTEALKYSYEVLAEYGNMSSPTVLFVLKRIMEKATPKRGDRVMLLSFGAGFTGFAALGEF